MTTPSKFDSRFVQSAPSPSGRKPYVWTLPEPPKPPRGRLGRLWDKLTERIAGMFDKPRPVVEPPEWFARAQGDSRLDINLDSAGKSDVRHTPVRPRPSLPAVNLPG